MQFNAAYCAMLWHVYVAKQHSLHLLLPLASKRLGDRWIDGAVFLLHRGLFLALLICCDPSLLHWPEFDPSSSSSIVPFGSELQWRYPNAPMRSEASQSMKRATAVAK